MGKRGLMALTLVIGIQLALIFFVPNLDGTANIPGDALFGFVTNPDFSGGTFTNVILDFLRAAGLLAIAVGFFIVRNEWAAFAGLTLIFFSFAGAILQLNQRIVSGFSSIPPDAAIIITATFMSGLILAYLMAMLDFIRGRD